MISISRAVGTSDQTGMAKLGGGYFNGIGLSDQFRNRTIRLEHIKIIIMGTTTAIKSEFSTNVLGSCLSYLLGEVVCFNLAERI